ncbi:MAG: ribonuclease domain-containing protein [Oliverpabstia sp.]
MKKKLRYILSILVLVLSLLGGCGVSVEVQDTPSDETEDIYVVTEEADRESDTSVDEDGEYTSRDDVAAYLHLYQHLPSNFITKKEAKALGWESQKGNLGEVAPGKSIGGDYFGNYEGILPEAEGREYHECDIDSDGGYRGAKRIIYSNDGLIYYTEDHYETFTLLYGEEE